MIMDGIYLKILECKWNQPCKYGCGYTQLDCATPGMLTNCYNGGIIADY